MPFGRIKSLDAILSTAESRSLHRSMGPFQLTMLGVGGVIGTGIFVLTAEAAQKAGPGMMVSFVISAFVCAVAALCYAELASMVPVSGSAYTYTYAVNGEVLAWTVGWALILEYALGASAVAVGWSNFAVGLLKGLGINVPPALQNGDALMASLRLWAGAARSPELLTAAQTGGYFNLMAVLVSIVMTMLLVIGTQESARVNAVLVLIKIAALSAFVAITVPVIRAKNFTPFLPTGTTGVLGAAASIFFAYTGFDAVSTAAEETKNPQRNVPIGLIGSLVICTIFYCAVAAGAIGAISAQPLTDLSGQQLAAGSPELAGRCALLAHGGGTQPLVCSKEALVHVLDLLGWNGVGRFVGLAAVVALPSVLLIMMFGQTRIFFGMARDGLLPGKLADVHPRFRTPHIITIVTGTVVTIAAAVLPVGKLADYSNSGTLFAFMMVAIAVLVLRKTDPGRRRPFRTPAVNLVAPAAIIGCIGLYLSLPATAILVLPSWGIVGLLFYASYGRRHSHVGRAAAAEAGAG